MSVRETAYAAERAGLSVTRVMEDGSKRPLGRWKRLQKQRLTADEVHEEFHNTDPHGVGIVSGKISGNLEVLDFETYEIWSEFKERANEAGLWPLLRKVLNGYCEKCPGGGRHLLYQCDEIAGNTKLAKDADGKVLIETRGEGGMAIVTPSHGPVHPNGKPWVLLRGGFDSIVEITPEERADLWALARTFDLSPPKPIGPVERTDSRATGIRLGDVFNASATWPDVLNAHDWKRIYEQDGVTGWRRPGKDVGISATTNYAGSDLLYVFSTSTVFDAERGYSKFSAYALLNHEGDFSAAASQLAQDGFGSSDEPSSDSAWSDPIPLSAAPPPPPFPLDALSPWLEVFVDELSIETGTPPDLAGMLALAAVSGAISKAARVKPRPGWSEPLNLYTTVALSPGNRKSAVVTAVGNPIIAFERDLVIAQRPAINEAASTERILKKSLDDAERAAAKNPHETGVVAQLSDARSAFDAFRPMAAPRLLAEDATPEALTSLLAEHGGTILVLSGEGDLFDIIAGRHSDGKPRLGVFTKGHSGEPLRVDRKGRASEYVPSARLTLGLAVQPGVLSTAAESRVLGERGVLARLLYSVPTSLIGYRDPVAPAMSASTRQTYERHITTLYRDAVAAADGLQEPVHVLRFDATARIRIETFLAALEPRLRPDGDLCNIEGWTGKLAGPVARIAACLHAAAYPSDWLDRKIGAQSVENAIVIGEYLIAHAKIAFAEMAADSTHATAHRIFRWIQTTEQTQFSARDAFNANRALKNMDAVRAGLNILVEHGIVRPTVEELKNGQGRSASTKYDVHPQVLRSTLNSADSADSAEPQSTQQAAARTSQKHRPKKRRYTSRVKTSPAEETSSRTT